MSHRISGPILSNSYASSLAGMSGGKLATKSTCESVCEGSVARAQRDEAVNGDDANGCEPSVRPICYRFAFVGPNEIRMQSFTHGFGSGWPIVGICSARSDRRVGGSTIVRHDCAVVGRSQRSSDGRVQWDETAMESESIRQSSLLCLRLLQRDRLGRRKLVTMRCD